MKSRLTHLPIHDIELSPSFAADFISEFIKACEKGRAGGDLYHSWKVCIMTYMIGKRMGLSDPGRRELFFASLLHDIGGVMVGGHVVEKLTQVPDVYGQKNDFLIFAHPYRSQTIMRSFPTFRQISKIVGAHHEFFDGSGFPSGLKGEEIPLAARMIRLADSVDITLKLHHIDDLNELLQFLHFSVGEEFDPAVFEAFRELVLGDSLLDMVKDSAEIERNMKKIKSEMNDTYYFASPDTLNRFFRMISIVTDNLTSPSSLHSLNVSDTAVQIAGLMGLPDTELMTIRWTGFLHDIGKLVVDRSVYFKKEKLSEEEWMQIHAHPQLTYDILNMVDGLDKIAFYALYHHENFDGSGYPEHLKGSKIPLGSRILHIADAFEAMTSNRVYQRKKDWLDALDELKKNRGTQFDPEIVDTFVKEFS